MENKKSADVAVIGAGIVGLAHAYMCARKGLKVVVFEREEFAVGASVRNFGLLWPIGQAPGAGLDRALRSRQHWQEISEKAGLWLKPNGSLHLAYHADEWDVLQEFAAMYQHAPYSVSFLTPDQVVVMSPGVKRSGLKGALHSTTEATVYSREAIRQIPQWLEQEYQVQFIWGQAVTAIEMPWVKTPQERWQVDHTFVCSGNDFETLYPAFYQQHMLTKCKLHMLKASTDTVLPLGPSLCAGLTLRHYDAFHQCPSLAKVSSRYDLENSLYKEYGVHVLVSQNAAGEFILGDSHQYGKTIEPFDPESVNAIILGYLDSFFHTERLTITERWHGVYPKYKAGLHLLLEPEKNVTIVNGLGGAGMTLSFGLAEEVVNKL